MVRLTHLSNPFHTLGGVQLVLQHHHRQDASVGLDSQLIIFYEEANPPVDRVHFLGFDGRTTIREARRKLSAAIRITRPEVAVYHGMWGMPFLADLDGAARRILVLHGEIPDLDRFLRSRRAWVDGILCVSEPLRQIVVGTLPEIAADRIDLLPYPIAPPPLTPERPPLHGRPLVLGISGRLRVEQKRLDRLPALCRQLDDAGISYRMEFLGDGEERGWLEGQFPDRAKYTFHGRRTGEEYWRALSQWDVIVFTTDYEGTPIALLEAMSLGVLPIYPRINSGGDAYARNVASDFLYEPEDFSKVAQVLLRLTRSSEVEIHQFRRRSREAVAHHMGDSYLRKFASFVRMVLDHPPIATSRFPRRPWPVDQLSFAWIERLAHLRRALQRLSRG